MKIIEDENGNEIQLYTPEELEEAKAAEKARIEAEFQGKLEEKDAHMKDKLDEFLKGKQAIDLREKTLEDKIEAANKIAQEAIEKAAMAEQRRIDAIKNAAIKQFTGGDEDLITKFTESWDIINLTINDDSDIFKKAELVANLVGMNSNVTGAAGIAMSGAMAPKITPAEQEKQNAEYDTFKKVLGMDQFIGKKE